MEFPPVEVNGRTLPVKCIYTRNRNAYARVSNGSIVISLPRCLGRGSAFKAANDLYSRIRKSIIRKPEMYLHGPADELRFTNGQALSILGSTFTVSVSDADRRTAMGRLQGSCISITIPEEISEQQRQSLVSSITRRIISKAIKDKLVERVECINRQHFNSNIAEVRLASASTRWGSCSTPKSSGARIMLNFKLLLMDEKCLEYVIVHELAHTKERNHTRRFWETVGLIIPDYKERRRLLKESKYGQPATTSFAMNKDTTEAATYICG